MGNPLKRYPFPGPEWLHVQWVSEPARSLWEPRIHAISQAFQAAERASVGSFRDACLQTVSPEQLPELNAKAIEQGLTLLVLQRQGDTGIYQAAPVPVEQAPNWNYRVALATKMAAPEFLGAWKAGDDETLGKLLGFPADCRAFFRRVWVEEKWIDTTWPMVGAPGAIEATVAGPVECNILLRWIGVRWIPHLPCSFDCEDTADFGREFRHVMPQREASWMDELLDSPIEWSALHGIAEIKTPLFTINTKTDATAGKLVVRRKGSTYPELGAKGLRFPYHREPHLLNRAEGAEKTPPISADQQVRPSQTDSDAWTDNGFSSPEGMAQCHAMLLGVLSGNYGTVVDLGCGNGRLLREVKAARRVGVESDAKKAGRARERVDRIIVGDCTDRKLLETIIAQERPDVIIAQKHRNPPESIPPGVRVLTYSYEEMKAGWR